MDTAVLDTGALIAIERARPLVLPLVQAANAGAIRAVIPAGCLAQAIRRPSRQAVLNQFLKLKHVTVLPLDRKMAGRIGALLSISGGHDVIDAHVAITGLDRGATIFTSDPEDIRRLAPGAAVQPI